MQLDKYILTDTNFKILYIYTGMLYTYTNSPNCVVGTETIRRETNLFKWNRTSVSYFESKIVLHRFIKDMLYKGLHLEIQIVWEYYCTYGTHSRQEYSMLVKIIFFQLE